MSVASAEQRKAILVLGMHRSGTSALTRVLNLLGVELGKDLMAPAEGNNPLGFWEHQRVVDIHNMLLSDLGRSWHDTRALPEHWLDSAPAVKACQQLTELLREEFACSPLWAVKDPRLCRLLPLWQQVMQQLGVVPHALLVLRHPDEVANSLRVRDGLAAEQTRLAWLEHMAEAVLASESLPRVAVTYDQLLSDWPTCMQRVAREFALTWPIEMTQARMEVNSFLNVDERHHQMSLSPLAKHPSSGLIEQLYASLQIAAIDKGWEQAEAVAIGYQQKSPAFLDAMAQDQDELQVLRAQCAEQTVARSNLEGQIDRLTAAAQELAAQALLQAQASTERGGAQSLDNAKLYFREGDQQSYSEERSVAVTFGAGYDTQTLEFLLPMEAKVVSLRFDPSEYPGVFELWGLRIGSHAVDDIARRMDSCHQFVLKSHQSGRLRFAAYDTDPHIELDLRDLVDARGLEAASAGVRIELMCRRLGLRQELLDPIEIKLDQQLCSLQSTHDQTKSQIQAGHQVMEASMQGLASVIETSMQGLASELKSDHMLAMNGQAALSERLDHFEMELSALSSGMGKLEQDTDSNAAEARRLNVDMVEALRLLREKIDAVSELQRLPIWRRLRRKI